MKILHLITTINRGGAENQLLTLVAQQVKDGLDVEILPLKGNLELKEAFIACGAKVLDVHANKFWIYQIITIRNQMKKWQPHVVHAHLPRAELTAALTTRKNGFLVTRHNSESFYPGMPQFISIMLSRFVVSRSAKVICISKAVKNFVVENREITGSAQVIYYGREISNLMSRDKSNREKFLLSIGLSSDLIVLSTLSRLTPQKDIPTMLRAFADVLKSNDKVHLIIGGSGELDDALHKISSELGITDHVTWLGQVTETKTLYNATDIFLLTSLYEGFGLVLLEAMSFQIPIVASNNTSIPEVLGSAHPGLFITGNKEDLIDKIKFMLDKNNLLDVISFQNSQIMKFDIKETSAQLSFIYRAMK